MTIPVYLRILLSLSVLACAATWWHGQAQGGGAQVREPARQLTAVAGESPGRTAVPPARPTGPVDVTSTGEPKAGTRTGTAIGRGMATGTGTGTDANTAPLPAPAPRQLPEVPGGRSPTALHERINLFPDQRRPRQAPAAALAVQPAVLAAPAQPAAPALPFTLVGAWWDGAQRTLVLDAHGAAVLACRQCAATGAKHVGDIVAANYRIKRIERGRLVFTYLPMQIEQVLALDELAFKPEP